MARPSCRALLRSGLRGGNNPHRREDAMPRRLWLPIISLASLLVFGAAWVTPDAAFAGATGCEEGFKLKNGKCKPVKKAKGCPAGTVPVPETDNCVPKANPAAEFEKEPWKKPG